MTYCFGLDGQKIQIDEPRLRDLAQYSPCQNCGVKDGTVVAAHSNEGRHGKGKGLKSFDIFVAYLCGFCHRYVDNQEITDRNKIFGNTNIDRKECLQWARDRTLIWLFVQGHLMVEPP